jgi:hypothetical protein
MTHLALKAASTLVHSHVEGGWWFASLLVAVGAQRFKIGRRGEGNSSGRARGSRPARVGARQLIEAVGVLPRRASGNLERGGLQRPFSAGPRAAENGFFAAASVSRALASLHEPAVTHDQRLPGQCVAFEPGKKNRGLRHVLNSGEFAVDRVLQHHVLDDVGL